MSQNSQPNPDLSTSGALQQAPESDLAAFCHSLSTLWTTPAEAVLHQGPGASGPQDLEFLVVPNRRNPAMVLPAGAPRAAAAAASRWGGSGGLVAKAKQSVLVTSLRMRLENQLLPDRIVLSPNPETAADPEHSLVRFLCEKLGEEIYIAMRVGSLRANRKPVLQAVTADGTVLAFVKLGHDGLTKQLVSREGAALEKLHAARLSSVLTPKPLFSGPWNHFEALVMTTLPWIKPERDTPALPLRAMQEVGQIDASQGTLHEAPFWAVLREQAASIQSDIAGDLNDTLDRLQQLDGDTSLALGSWHGDWTPWNMSVHKSTRLVWDWERFASGVPQGFDALHYRLNDLRLVQGNSMDVALLKLGQEATEVFKQLGLNPLSAGSVYRLYLAEMATRYLADGQHPSGVKVRQHGKTLADYLRTLVERRMS